MYTELLKAHWTSFSTNYQKAKEIISFYDASYPSFLKALYAMLCTDHISSSVYNIYYKKYVDKYGLSDIDG